MGGKTVILRIYLNFICVCVCVCTQFQIENAHRRLNITFKEENTDTHMIKFKNIYAI